MRWILVLIAFFFLSEEAFAANGYDSSGNLVASGLTASRCMSNSSGNVVATSGGSCSTMIISSVTLAGTLIQGAILPASANADATFTFPTAYTNAPICSANSYNVSSGGSNPNFQGNPTTTSAVVHNNNGGGINIGVLCVGF